MRVTTQPWTDNPFTKTKVHHQHQKEVVSLALLYRALAETKKDHYVRRVDSNGETPERLVSWDMEKVLQVK